MTGNGEQTSRALEVLGYTDRFSYEPGDKVTLMASSPGGEVSVELVELKTGPPPNGGAAVEPKAIPWSTTGTHPCRPMRSCLGSFVAVEQPWQREPISTFSVGGWIWPTLPSEERTQAILGTRDSGSGEGVVLALESGDLVLRSFGKEGLFFEAYAGARLVPRTWYFVLASVGEGRWHLAVQPLDSVHGGRHEASGELAAPYRLTAPRWLAVGASTVEKVVSNGSVPRGHARDHFNGKVEWPFVLSCQLPEDALDRCGRGETAAVLKAEGMLVGVWDFRIDMDAKERVRNYVSGELDGYVVNLPMRGVTSTSWTGRHLDFAQAPDEYAAIHFHDTDLADAGWEATFSAELPADLSSGVYGVRVSGDIAADTVPIVVVPKPGQEKARILVVMPSFSYLAYGNENLFSLFADGAMTGKEVRLSEVDRARAGRTDIGLSAYDHHSDMSGVAFSGWRRPLVNIRHDYLAWGVEAGREFSGDMYLIEWLERKGFAYDVVTDLELHKRGAAGLHPYEVVVLGSHPEYFTERMLDALQDYRDGGGRIMYLGGNGLYWVTGVYSENPLVVEIRRGHAGVRTWESLPGEVTLLSTGEPGGLWRHRGRPPQKLVCVGMATQGIDASAAYRRTEASRSGPTAWIFEGVDEDPLGAYGRVMGGAAGDELDRVDFALGTPRQTVVLATSRGHSNYYQRAIEELFMLLPGLKGGENDPEIRADLAYCALPGGGEVFATGSIAWTGALLEKDCDNGVSRVTENVLRRFAGLSKSHG
jgi:N,N-dimethylformamidase